ncbi:MAG: hypothetical protein ABFS10_05255 [Bacteroidota bacterium]
MKKTLNIRSITALMLALSMLFAVASCDKEPVDERPELPPVESLQMDFSAFAEQPAAKKGTGSTVNNFLYSYLTVGFWNLSAGLVTVLPVMAYGHALQQTPVYMGDNSWEWSFDFNDVSMDYTVTLTAARINNEEFSVEMVVASALTSNQEVKWFDGVVRYDHTHASWTLYKDGTIALLGIEWNKDYETGEADLKYSYTEPDQNETGSFIMLEYMPEEVYDASYTISLTAGVTNIEWNTTTIEGRVKAPSHFGDDAWHCWDSHDNGLIDIDCL